MRVHLWMAPLIIWVVMLSPIVFAAEEPEKPSEVFELEFIPKADLYRTANYLRAEGFNAVVTDLNNTILIQSDSYTKALDRLQSIVPTLPDISRFTWINGNTEVVLYESQEANLLVKDHEIAEKMKVLAAKNDFIDVTIILRDDKESLVRYESIAKQIEERGYRITWANGIMDFGWVQQPALQIVVNNNILSVKQAIYSLSEIEGVSHITYNRGRAPHQSNYLLTFSNTANFDLQISRLLANGVEVYKIDPLLNRIFIHFPNSEARNYIKIEQIKQFEDLIAVKDLHRNKDWLSPLYAKNTQHIWLDIPEEILNLRQNQTEYLKRLNRHARGEIAKLGERGLIVLNYGVYSEVSDVLIPEVVVTYKNTDKTKADEALKYYNLEARLSVQPSGGGGRCASLFNND